MSDNRNHGTPIPDYWAEMDRIKHQVEELRTQVDRVKELLRSHQIADWNRQNRFAEELNSGVARLEAHVATANIAINAHEKRLGRLEENSDEVFG